MGCVLSWRHLVNAYGVISLVRLFPAAYCRYCSAVLRGSLLYVLSYVTSVRLSSWIDKGDYYYYYYVTYLETQCSL